MTSHEGEEGSPPTKMTRRSMTSALASDPPADDDLDLLSVGSNNLSLDSSRSETPTFGKSKGKRGKRGPKSASPQFRYKNHFKEDHGQPLFGIQINPYTRDKDPLVFATVGSNRASVYESSRGEIRLIQAYCDPDVNEGFYTCAWTIDEDTKQAVLLTAGAKGIVRVICPLQKMCIKNMTGHGNAINELRVHPLDPNLVLSASKDHNIRMWHLKSDVCVAIFGGVEGHRAEVLSVDFNLEGTRLVSCGMDHSVKIWHLDKPLIADAIAKSYQYESKNPLSFKTACAYFPDYTTREVHHNYVDCVRYFGDLILSKSCENKITCWRDVKLTSTEKEEKKNTFVLREFQSKDCDIWFMRFCLDYGRRTMALGNQVGKIYVWDMEGEDASRCSILSNNRCVAAIRQCDFSRDGSVLLAVADDATVWQWEKPM